MYYVCDKDRMGYGIKDTSDGVVEYYSESKVRDFVDRLGITVVGVDSDCIRLTGTVEEFMSWYSNSLCVRIVNAITELHTVTVKFTVSKFIEDATFRTNHSFELSRSRNGGLHVIEDGRSKSYRSIEESQAVELIKSSIRNKGIISVKVAL